jgi:hypothetical protein
MKSSLRLSALPTIFLLVAATAPAAAPDSQKITIEHSLQIPGEVLTPGSYVFSLEDRLRGRAIVRVDNVASGQHSFLLTVPSLQIGTHSNNRLIFFRSQGSQEILRGWLCPGCAKPLEFVYAKADAAKITEDTGQSVLAADPAYDKLPANLSADDMKVVTLWLLSPERVSNNHGVGLTAAKYSAPAGMPAVPTRNRLPQTASNAYSWGAMGLLLLSAFAGLRWQRVRCAS